MKKLLAPTTSILSLAILSATAVTLAAGCGSGGKVVRTATVQKAAVVRTVTVQQKAADLSATGDQRLYGQIKSLERKGLAHTTKYCHNGAWPSPTSHRRSSPDRGRRSWAGVPSFVASGRPQRHARAPRKR